MSSEVLKPGYTGQWCKLRLYLKELLQSSIYSLYCALESLFTFALMHVKLNKM